MRRTIWSASAALVFGWAMLGGITATSTPANAEEWCGFHEKAGSRVQCGYSSEAECHRALGKDDTQCIVDPYIADNRRQTRADG